MCVCVFVTLCVNCPLPQADWVESETGENAFPTTNESWARLFAEWIALRRRLDDAAGGDSALRARVCFATHTTTTTVRGCVACVAGRGENRCHVV